jgi:hypothetical protein
MARRLGSRLNIGLLMTHNEVDVVAEVLEVNAAHVDTILALDGSSDGTLEIVRAHPKVELVLRDEEVTQGGRVGDWHRGVLLEAARERYGPGQWYTLLHGDEFFHDDPRAVIERAEREGAGFVNWAAMQFFLHTSDEGRDLESVRSVQERVRWYSPFWIEVRQFRDRPGARYREGEHGRVFPRGVGWRPFSRLPVLKHYPYRSPSQVTAKRASGGFSESWYDGPVFRETFSSEYRTARRFSGDFGELELERQGSLLSSWRWGRRLVHRGG